MNLFATVLTYPAPSANYRGESEQSRTVIQKITDGKFDYPIISPEAIRNAMREILKNYNIPCNRERLHDEKQLAVRYKQVPDPKVYADDFLFGYLMALGDDEKRELKLQVILDETDGRGADLRVQVSELFEKLKPLEAKVKKSKKKGDEDEEQDDEDGAEQDKGTDAEGADAKKLKKEIKKHRDKLNRLADGFGGLTFKRDSVLRMNLAKALEPYRYNTVFTQSPQFAEGNPWKVGSADKAGNSSLLHRETAHTAFQYPFALAGADCAAKPDWVKALLKAVGELSGVAGNHARSYFEMAPASVAVRLTPQLVAGYQTYGFRTVKKPDGEEFHLLPEVTAGILHAPKADYPGGEFYLGGKVVKDMTDDEAAKLTKAGVTLDRDPRRLLDVVAAKFLGGK